MTQPSESVLKELRHLQEEWDAGVEEGFNADPNRFPDFFSKPYKNFTARQRGYVVGHELRIHEKVDGDHA